MCWHRTLLLGALGPGAVIESLWTYPHPFVGVIAVIPAPYGPNSVGSQRGASTFASGPTSEGIGVSVWDARTSGPALNAYLNLVAVGYWK